MFTNSDIDKNLVSKSNNADQFLLIKHLIVHVLFCLICFSRISGYLTRTYDLQIHSAYTDQAFKWNEFSLGVGNSLLHGLSGLDFPLQQLLIPEYLVSRLFTAEVNFTLLFLAGSLELFISTCFLSRSLKLSWDLSISSAWIMSLLAFGWTDIRIGNLYWMMPDYAHLISIFAVLIGLIIRIGNLSILKNFGLGFLFLGSLVWVFLSQPTMLTLLFPLLGVISTAVILGNRPIRSRKSLHQLLTLVSCVVFFSAFGFFSYLYGLISYTTAAFFASQLFNERQHAIFISQFLFGTITEKIFFIIGLFGLLSYVFRNRIAKAPVFGALVALSLIWVYGSINSNSKTELGPSANYYEHLIYPFFAIGLAISLNGFCLLAIGLIKRVNRASFLSAILNWVLQRSAFMLAGMMLVVALGWISTTQGNEFISSQKSNYPPAETSISRFLQNEIGLYKGDIYRGRVLNITDIDTGVLAEASPKVSWPETFRSEQYIQGNTGNDLRGPGLLYFGIPRLSQYNPHVSPAFFRFATRFLSYDTDVQNRNEVITRRVNLPVLRMLGVRFIISNRDMPSLLLREQIILPNGSKVSLYDIGVVNVGNYSPTKVVVSESLVESFGVIGNPDFDAKVTVVSDVDISGSFVPVSTSLISHKGNDLLVEGTSPGTSILLLPFEFSRCFDVTARSGVKPILFRANTLLTGVVFTGSVDVWLKYRTGPFHNSTCRIQDSNDFTKLLENKTNK